MGTDECVALRYFDKAFNTANQPDQQGSNPTTKQGPLLFTSSSLRVVPLELRRPSLVTAL